LWSQRFQWATALRSVLNRKNAPNPRAISVVGAGRGDEAAAAVLAAEPQSWNSSSSVLIAVQVS